MWSSMAPKVSMTTGVNSLAIDLQIDEYLDSFLEALLCAAAPGVVDDGGEAERAVLLQGSAMAPSKKWWLPGTDALGITASADLAVSGGKYPYALWQWTALWSSDLRT